MKVNMIEEFTYNGLFVTTKKIKPRPVEILGVFMPADPGMVVIKDRDIIREVPTCVLDAHPGVDWNVLLSKDQIDERDKLSVLWMPSGERNLLPLVDVPRKKVS